MKISTLIVFSSLGLCGAACAQDSTGVRGRIAGESETSASVGRDGATASHAASAASAVETEQAQAGFTEVTELHATLSRRIDSRKAQAGDEVTATVAEDVKAGGEVVLTKGTRLVGRVTEAKRYGADGSAASDTESRLAIVFERAVPRYGPEVPIHATIRALAETESTVRSRGLSAPARTDGAAAGTSAARASGGLLGGAGRVVRRAAGAGGAVTGVAGAAGGVVRSSARTSGSVTGESSRSAGAIGGLDAAGRFRAGSHGIFGLGDLGLVSRTAGSAQGSVITSATRNVRLESGTRLLLVAGTNALAYSP